MLLDVLMVATSTNLEAAVNNYGTVQMIAAYRNTQDTLDGLRKLGMNFAQKKMKQRLEKLAKEQATMLQQMGVDPSQVQPQAKPQKKKSGISVGLSLGAPKDPKAQFHDDLVNNYWLNGTTDFWDDDDEF